MPPVVNPGVYRHWVDLDNPEPEGAGTVYVPSHVKCLVEPAPPDAFGEMKITHFVRLRYHAQISFNTRVIHEGRSLYVRGVQDVEEAHREMRLLCEEVKPA